MNEVPSSVSGYRSPAREPSWFASRFPSLAFYAGLAGIVRRASRKAKAGHYDDQAWIASSLETVALLESVGATLTVDNVGAYARATGPVVIVGNHMSTLETFALPCMLVPHSPATFVVKQQLVEMPVFKHVMRSRNPVVVGRSDARDDFRIVMKEGAARLKAGISVIVFPQTTRDVAWDPSKFNSVAAKLASRADVPLMPLALRTDAWGNGRRIKDCGPVRPQLPIHFRFADPIKVTGNGRDAHEEVVRFITDQLATWGLR